MRPLKRNTFGIQMSNQVQNLMRMKEASLSRALGGQNVVGPVMVTRQDRVGMTGALGLNRWLLTQI